MTLGNILQQLQHIGANPHRNGNGWVARCPAHNDTQSALSIKDDDNANCRLECSAGCSRDSIIDALRAPNTIVNDCSGARPCATTQAADSATTDQPDKQASAAAPKTATGKKQSYGLNDLYHARRIVQVHGADIRHCRKLGGFFVWDGTRWFRDETGNVWRWAIHTAWTAYRESLHNPSPYPHARLKKWVERAECSKSIQHALKQLQAQPEVIATPDSFDRDPWLLNVTNGTIDLRTGTLSPHRREDLITKIAPVTFDPDCPLPHLWQSFLSQIFEGNQRLTAFVQRACGYALTGSVSEQKLFFLHGPGANGKTTFLNTLMSLMGAYARRLPSSLLLASTRDSHPTRFADLKGCRLAVTSEVEFGKQLAEAAMKEITGGDRLTARRMRQDYFQFQPTHKIFMCGNHLPIVRGTDHALWRRINLIPFNVIIPEEQQDKDLPEKLRAEASGILNWLVTGCLEWQKHGLSEPPEVLTATRAYRTDMDTLSDFLNERCVLEPNACEKAADLNHAFREWCDKNGERTMSAYAFGLQLKERGFHQDRTRSARIWKGLRLKGTSTQPS
ncbi:MAG: hypothetical protein C4532_17700 [Candidatus Abyssobacteria bacterium SURF_17]|uniref:SF3 helicase domain-containing protein n=1 Tax=Candidatus Abyssobacteria bacterium SURF_17 TaxID=2093361 RepID=A0A419EQP4_9BACT|nr:MAG: hypothetical protein C4532_17700 [Candidatus Abyssubacteria bacterium SURF_17]